MSTDVYGFHRGDEPLEVDGVTYYPTPRTTRSDEQCGTCDAHAFRLSTCHKLPGGCGVNNFIWRTGFEAAVQWAARTEQKKETP